MNGGEEGVEEPLEGEEELLVVGGNVLWGIPPSLPLAPSFKSLPILFRKLSKRLFNPPRNVLPSASPDGRVPPGTFDEPSPVPPEPIFSARDSST
jgi:hypothetical protein